MNGGFVAKEADASMQQEIDSKFFTDAIIKLSKKIKTLLLLIKVIEVDNQTIFWNKKTFGDIIRTHKCYVKVTEHINVTEKFLWKLTERRAKLKSCWISELLQRDQIRTLLRTSLQFQIIVSPRLLIFGFSVGPPFSYLDSLPLFIFQILFHRYLKIYFNNFRYFKTDCSICENVSNLDKCLSHSRP